MNTTTHGILVNKGRLNLIDLTIDLLLKTFKKKEIKRICIVKTDDDCIAFTDDYSWSKQFPFNNRMELIVSEKSRYLRHYTKNGVYSDLAEFIVSNANCNGMLGLKLALTTTKHPDTHLMTKRVFMNIVK